MNVLNMEEKRYAERHHYIVERFLEDMGLDESIYYDVIIFGYLDAVQKYLNNEKLRNYTFFTVAWRIMKKSLYNYWKAQDTQRHSAKVISIDRKRRGGFSLEELTGSQRDVSDVIANKLLLERVMSHITSREREAINLLLLGYTYAETAKEIGISKSGVGSRISRMRSRVRKNIFDF